MKKIKKINRLIFWTPRILGILIILFLALFSLDVFDSCKSFLECSLGLFMHNLPVIIILFLFVLAWKKEIIGFWTFFIAGLLYITLVISTIIKNGFEWYYLSWIIIISLPLFLIAYLFYICWKAKKKA